MLYLAEKKNCKHVHAVTSVPLIIWSPVIVELEAVPLPAPEEMREASVLSRELG